MLAEMRSILLISGILLLCSAADLEPRRDDQGQLQVTQEASRDNREAGDNEIDPSSTWSIRESKVWEGERGDSVEGRDTEGGGGGGGGGGVDLGTRRREKEDRRKRKRFKHQRKLRKTLQEEAKRRNRLAKLVKEARKEEEETTTTKRKKRRPNIIFILADDLGYNDVPWHNPDIKAPELLRLARKGVVLENHYVMPLCAPSRAALLTGTYPFRYGKQASSAPLSPTGLNTSLTLLPESLKSLGYQTHLVGKWHLGYCNTAYTPTSRGFDSFYGFYLGSQTYFTRFKKLSPKKGIILDHLEYD